MKKAIILLCLVSMMLASFSSCTTMKRDCQGRKHERLKNGIYL